MPVNTVEIPRALRDLVDAFVLDDPTREHGGFLFGTPLRFETFLPVPNTSRSPKNQYRPPENWPAYAQAFARAAGCGLVAHLHTHPNHSIPSGRDFDSGRFWFRHVHYMVLVAPNASASKTTWWVLDQNAEVQELAHTDENLEASALLFARRFGYADLGTVLMNRRGELHAQGAIAQALLASPDARKLYAALAPLPKGKGPTTKKELQALSGLSAARTDAAARLLADAGLLTIPQHSWERYHAADVFGRRLP